MKVTSQIFFLKKTDESVIKAKNHINYKKYDIIHTIIGVSKIVSIMKSKLFEKT